MKTDITGLKTDITGLKTDIATLVGVRKDLTELTDKVNAHIFDCDGLKDEVKRVDQETQRSHLTDFYRKSCRLFLRVKIYIGYQPLSRSKMHLSREHLKVTLSFRSTAAYPILLLPCLTLRAGTTHA